MDPAARSPSETDAVAAEMGGARRAAIYIRARLRSLFRVPPFIARDGIEATTADPPRRQPSHRQLDQSYQSHQGGLVRSRLLFRGPDDDTAPQSEGRGATSDDDTTRRLGTAHTTTPQGEGRDSSTTSEATRRPDFTFTANVDGSRGLAYRSSVTRDSNEAPAFAAVIGLLAYGSCVVIGLLTEFDHTVGGWNAAATVSYGLLVLLATSLLGFGVMASVAGSSTMLWVSDLCARLGAVLCTALLIVAFSCKMGKPWGCAAGVPFAAVVACAMGAIGIWGRARALWDRVVGPRRRRQPPGPGDENV